jgi:hypothetical protein
MSCNDGTCGTGGWGGPLPGDPSSNSILTATPAFGGIDINYTLPTVNPFAVAFAILYRGIIPDFAGAIVHRDGMNGGFYFDKVDPPTEYFYWIQFVSVNGTHGDIIGPVSAIARLKIEETIEVLTGQIDDGLLAQSLKTDIAQIPLIDNKIFLEIANRLIANATLSAAIAQVQDNADASLAFVQEEITQRQDADAALVTSINLLYTQAAGNAAAILEEKTIRASKDDAMAADIETLTAAIGDGGGAALEEEKTVRANADSALAAAITTAQTTLNGNIASAQTTLQTNINIQAGRITSIGALYTAKVTVNGLIGGFGVYNDGTTVEAGFDVDTFWVGRTAANKRKPFIIVGSETFIDEAVINKLTFDKLRAADGSLIVSGGKVQAQYLEVGSLTAQHINVASGGGGTNRMYMNDGLIQVYDSNNVLRVRIGVW